LNREPRTDVFFYGLFMDPDVLRSQAVEPVAPRRASAEGQALRIGKRATLVAQHGARAWGMVYALSDADLARLYDAPGLEDYRRATVKVRLIDGGELDAACYTLPRAPTSGEANADYADRLRGVLARLGFPADGMP
jgi:hypothetical protein